MPGKNDILAVILGGGRGTRLHPLTRLRSKPAVPIAGKYRLIDIPISNCINSGIYKIDVLTQFNSHSLHRHITQTYHLDTFHAGFVEILAAEQTPESADWYQGTADALRKQLFQIRSAHAERVLVLAGDHLYRMDYSAMAEFHEEQGADISVAVQPVRRDEIHALGVLKRAADGRITDFIEKPKDPEVQDRYLSDPASERPFLASMGIYLFNTQVLIDLLNEHPDFDDFGSDILPEAIKDRRVAGYEFDGYWRDIGTIRSFYEVNLELTRADPPFDLFDSRNPIYTHARFLPGSVVADCRMKDVLLAEGCHIQEAEIEHSVIGVRTSIASGTVIRDSVVMGADYYDAEHPGKPAIGIGANCRIEGAIIDKNARVGNGVVIRPFPLQDGPETPNWCVREGIVVIPKNAVIPDGTHIEPGA